VFLNTETSHSVNDRTRRADGRKVQTSFAPPPSDTTGSFPPDDTATRALVLEDGFDPELLLAAHLRRLSLGIDTIRTAAPVSEKVLSAVGTGRPYCLVFLDVRAGGLAAARQLRAYGYAGPLVALVAKAGTDERDQCLAVGCAAVLVVPVRPSALETLVRSTTGGNATREWIVAPGTPIFSDLAHDEEITDLVAKFVRLIPERLEAFARAFSERDFHTLRRLSHQMSGGAACYGFPSISAAAGMLEQSLLREASPEDVAGQVSRLVAVGRLIQVAP
jgi:hypothetical protein